MKDRAAGDGQRCNVGDEVNVDEVNVDNLHVELTAAQRERLQEDRRARRWLGLPARDTEPESEEQSMFPYLASLQSPRLLELEAIVADANLPREKRLQAAAEIELIEDAIDRRTASRAQDAVSKIQLTRLAARPIGGGFRKTWPPGPCRKHGGLVPCSECHKKRKRRRPPTLRYAELAREVGWEPIELRRFPGPGRKTPEQRVADADRREALRTVVRMLRAENYTQKAIAEALGCRQSTVAKLLRASPG